MARIQMEPAYILHSRSFRETSLIVEAFTREYGRVAVVARGAKSARSRWRNVLQPFRPLLLSWNLKGDLGTLTAADQVASPPALQGQSLFCGLYLNELLMRLLHPTGKLQALFSNCMLIFFLVTYQKVPHCVLLPIAPYLMLHHL